MTPLTAEESRKLGAMERSIEVLEMDLNQMKHEKEECLREMANRYLTKETFESKFSPVRLIAYGLIAVVMTMILGALMTLILKGSLVMPVATKIGGM
jgi:hypothetical protein